jgi:outer membrane protein OmpA-like peptidoglycan-associated protein
MNTSCGKNTICQIAVFVILSITGISSVYGQSSSLDMLTPFQEKIKTAESQDCDLFSPAAYRQTQESMQKIQQRLGAGKNWRDVEGEYNKAIVMLEKAVQTSAMIQEKFPDFCSNRKYLRTLDPDPSGVAWREKTNDLLDKAIECLRESNTAEAGKKILESNTLQIKVIRERLYARNLSETANRVKEYVDTGMSNDVPLSVQKVSAAIEAAEVLIESQLRETDEVKAAAKKAAEELAHAAILADWVKKSKQMKMTTEEMRLLEEEQLQKIADVADCQLDFGAGIDFTIGILLKRIEGMKQISKETELKLANLDRDNVKLTEDVLMFKEQVRQLSVLRDSLYVRQDRQNALLDGVTRLSTALEGTQILPLYEEERLLLRLPGQMFPAGQSGIDSKYYPLLMKVSDALKQLECGTVTVESYTDSYGDDRTNKLLSQKRAETIRSFLLADGKFSESRMTAAGFGEERPIADNATVPGRTANNRLDIVIRKSQ